MTESIRGHTPNPSRVQDAQLVGGVVAFHVGAGIALGVALRLGGRQNFLVRALRLHHLREDEVGAAVDDAAHAADVVGRKAARDRVEHRRAAADRTFVPQRDVVGAGDRLPSSAP